MTRHQKQKKLHGTLSYNLGKITQSFARSSYHDVAASLASGPNGVYVDVSLTEDGKISFEIQDWNTREMLHFEAFDTSALQEKMRLRA